MHAPEQWETSELVNKLLVHSASSTQYTHSIVIACFFYNGTTTPLLSDPLLGIILKL